MNLYISDLHFGHTNAIYFDNRPFVDREQMDRCMIENWNNRVAPEDDVYILGDFCFRATNSPDWYLRQLQGHKHLVIGNHDQVTLNCERAIKHFDSIEKMMHVSDGKQQICLCHFPLAEWNKAYHGSWHIYGHIHARRTDVYQFMKTKDHALNAAACINNYTPVSFEELIRNNKLFQEQDDNLLE